MGQLLFLPFGCLRVSGGSAERESGSLCSETGKNDLSLEGVEAGDEPPSWTLVFLTSSETRNPILGSGWIRTQAVFQQLSPRASPLLLCGKLISDVSDE